MAFPVLRLDRVCQSLFVVALIGISSLALWPSQSLAITTGWDKSNHFLAFFVLGWLLDFAWQTRLSTAQKWVLLMSYGLLIEVVQAGMTARYSSFWDWLADFLGLAMYWILRPLFLNLYRYLQQMPMFRG